MDTEPLTQGLELMLAGMGVVFVFLTALVIATSLMSRLVLTFQPPDEGSSPTGEEVAAISAAIARHRRK